MQSACPGPGPETNVVTEEESLEQPMDHQHRPDRGYRHGPIRTRLYISTDAGAVEDMMPAYVVEACLASRVVQQREFEVDFRLFSNSRLSYVSAFGVD